MIQIDIPMPENCAKCPCDGLNEVERSRCNITGHEFHHNIFDGRAEDCPLKELEPVEPILSVKDRCYYCGNCDETEVKTYDHYCPKCGRELKW